jgi:hypothetical protein
MEQRTESDKRQACGLRPCKNNNKRKKEEEEEARSHKQSAKR